MPNAASVSACWAYANVWKWLVAVLRSSPPQAEAPPLRRRCPMARLQKSLKPSAETNLEWLWEKSLFYWRMITPSCAKVFVRCFNRKQILTRRVSPRRAGLMIGRQLPTPTKRAVKLHDGEQLVELKLHERFLRRKQQLLLLQNLIIKIGR